jgi:YD repeat protein
LRREDTLRRILEDIHGKGRVLTERTLLDANGNKVTHNGKGRRIDFIILDDKGNAIKSYEVTSKTANKVPQITKENTIRANGGTFIKDRNDNLVDISNIPTQIIRIR